VLTHCDVCEYEQVDGTEEPCVSCIYPNWAPTIEPMRCDTCLHDVDRPADKCGSCRGSNFKKRVMCTECGAVKPLMTCCCGTAMRLCSGNWICDKCGFVCMRKEL